MDELPSFFAMWEIARGVWRRDGGFLAMEKAYTARHSAMDMTTVGGHA